MSLKKEDRLCLEERQNGFIIVTLEDSKDVNVQTVKFHMVVWTHRIVLIVAEKCMGLKNV